MCDTLWVRVANEITTHMTVRWMAWWANAHTCIADAVIGRECMFQSKVVTNLVTCSRSQVACILTIAPTIPSNDDSVAGMRRILCKPGVTQLDAARRTICARRCIEKNVEESILIPGLAPERIRGLVEPVAALVSHNTATCTSPFICGGEYELNPGVGAVAAVTTKVFVQHIDARAQAGIREIPA